VGGAADAALTARAGRRQDAVSGPGHSRAMNDERLGAELRRAIGGDPAAISWIVDNADGTDDPLVVVMAALLERLPARLTRAQGLAVSSRDRQTVAIAGAHLAGDSELVDALARDHLVSYPDSLIVSWIAGYAPGSR